jgi:hypothetical protein
VLPGTENACLRPQRKSGLGVARIDNVILRESADGGEQGGAVGQEGFVVEAA